MPADGLLEGSEGCVERRRRVVGMELGEARTVHLLMYLGEEGGHPHAQLGELVAVGPGHSEDEPLALQPGEVVGGLPARVLSAQVLGHERLELVTPEGAEDELEAAESREQRCHPGVAVIPNSE